MLGGRYIALEGAQMFARFGSKVTILQRSDRILPTETPDLTDALASHLEGAQKPASEERQLANRLFH